MEYVLKNPSRTEIIKAIEENLFAWVPVLGKLGQVYKDNPPGVQRAITDLPFSLFNSVMDARLAPDQVDEAIQVVQADARKHGVPVLWWTGPSTRPEDLGKRLESYGFVVDEKSPGMAVVLADMVASLSVPAGLSVQLAEGDDAWQHWCIAMQLGFGAAASNERSVKAWCDLFRLADPGTILAYTGWYEGKPVATSLLFLAAGAAGIYAVATVPEARRKGFGAFITHYPLAHASSLGYEIGVLGASEMGFNVYHSLGFREYCRIDSYLWQPEKAGSGEE